MRVTYINLDRAADRRAALEQNFAATERDGWTLTRVPAVDGKALEPLAYALPLRGVDVALFLSHRDAIGVCADTPMMIVEDDTHFGPASKELIEQAVVHAPADWDMLYTDVCVPSFDTMVELFRMRRRRSTPALIPLRGMPFAGTTAYIVNPRSSARLLQLFESNDYAIPYDLWLRKLVYDGTIAAYLTFPFLTTLAPSAEDSQISPDVDVSLWNAFRRLVWYHADQKRAAEESARLFASAISA